MDGSPLATVIRFRTEQGAGVKPPGLVVTSDSDCGAGIFKPSKQGPGQTLDVIDFVIRSNFQTANAQVKNNRIRTGEIAVDHWRKVPLLQIFDDCSRCRARRKAARVAKRIVNESRLNGI